MSSMTPREIVQELDKHMIGQAEAKRAVASALRNRWRRAQVNDQDLRKEITPKNILMIGPTGVGKTEIARRLANLADAPFIKVEATKFTEVGYVGREVDSIIRDLADVAVKGQREAEINRMRPRAEDAAEERVLDILLPPARSAEDIDTNSSDGAARQTFRKKLREGKLDDKEVEIDIAVQKAGVEIFGPQGMEDLTDQLQGMMKNMGSNKTQARKVTIKEALKLLTEEEAAKLINEEDLKLSAIERLENSGIVFIDEIDKIVGSSGGGKSPEVSREGVQRDLLPLIEGSTISTKYGMIKTDHILFIGSGAFQLAKPSDLIPELQGRMPIRVELSALTVDDFSKILTEPNASLTQQYIALMNVEEVGLEFTEDGIRRIAELAWQVNESTENIGARRLHTMLERLLETISFEASDRSGDKININADYVNQHLDELAENEDYARYIL